MSQTRESRPEQQPEAAENKVSQTTTRITDEVPTSVYDVVASLDRLAAALADERRAYEDGFKAGYADGYQVGHVHGERVADETWSWALGAIGVGKREANPDHRGANRWRLLAGLGPKELETGQ
ncbi:hypothetical protein L0U85_09915 [Glycomyces sp. L485]|uniref:hypothetical protein n=1 Tax=Glycomyces sp. L485 TaxID=2909235 RepID=UPI001F4B75A3|nr:hypothetical protein [Glycomyces sp. L485]MCH7231165.1 hypothetical protein [Glycomyces sp. L485]